MKKVKLVEEVSGEGLESLLGEDVVVWCMNYIYSGRLVGVNDVDILIEDACVVYETGALDGEKFTNSQRLPSPLYIRLSAIESYYKRGF